MNRLFGLLTGAIASFITTYLTTQRQQTKEKYPRIRAGICDAQCRKDNHVVWNDLPSEDPRSPAFLSHLECVWLEDLEPDEAVDATGQDMEGTMFDYTVLLLDDLVSRGEMLAHEAEHLKDYYRAMIFRTIVNR